MGQSVRRVHARNHLLAVPRITAVLTAVGILAVPALATQAWDCNVYLIIQVFLANLPALAGHNAQPKTRRQENYARSGTVPAVRQSPHVV